jgi:hypothetical protein
MDIIDVKSIFDPLLLCDVEIIHNDKILKKGKLKLVSNKNHIIKLYLDVQGDIRTFEVLYPFSYRSCSDTIILDYSLEDLTYNDSELQALIEELTTDQSMPFLNTSIYIKKIK